MEHLTLFKRRVQLYLTHSTVIKRIMAESTLISKRDNQKESIEVKEYVTYVVSLSIATIILIATFIVNGVAGNGIGVANTTGSVSDSYYLQVTPAGWAFSIWGVIYAWQSLWILYGWSFVIRYKTILTIPSSVYIIYTGSSLCNITWIFLFNNYYAQAAFPFIFLTGVFLYIAIGIVAVHLYRMKQRGTIRVIDVWATWILVINGIAIYATWLTVATLINLGIVVQYYGDFSAVNTGTLCLSLLTVEVIVYFILENTVLDRFARYVLIVYPVIVWSLAAILSAHWNQEDDNRNPIFTLVLIILSSILLISRVVLVIIFTFVRKQDNRIV